jgi:hypothetical protein
MGCYILVLLGFIQIGIGSIMWLNTHQVQKTYTQTNESVRLMNGDQYGITFGDRFFEKHEIIEKPPQ